jgi:hypothetical protein
VLACSLLGVGVCGPGMPDWTAARAVLRGEAPYDADQGVAPVAKLLPPAERRRATLSVRVALAAAQEAAAMAGIEAAGVASVFASSSGSSDIVHEMCSMLAAGDYQVSPTKFHNSVHNASAGYFSIAAGSTRPASSVCAYDASAAAGLLEAAVQVLDEGRPVLLVAFDTPYPFPLGAVRRIERAWAVALMLGPAQSAPALARLRLSVGVRADETPMQAAALESMRLSNPAARLLPLLAAVARPGASTPRLLFAQQHGEALLVEVEQ